MSHDEVDPLVQSLRATGDKQALAVLFDRHRPGLRRFANRQIDRRLMSRLDASDVVQQAFLNAQSRIQHYVENPAVPFLVWLRTITLQTLIDFHRRHLNAKKRSVSQDVSLNQPAIHSGRASFLADRLAASLSSPSHLAMKAETRARLRTSIDQLDELDREVLQLRHFEELSNKQVAERLGLGQAAASNRYMRALTRLKELYDVSPASN